MSRFDGRRFFTLTTDDGLPHPDVNDIVEARDGSFWLATDEGITKFRLTSPGSTEKPKIVTIRSVKHPDDRYDALEFDREGRLWAGDHEGLYQVETTSEGDRLKWAGEPLPDAFIRDSSPIGEGDSGSPLLSDPSSGDPTASLSLLNHRRWARTSLQSHCCRIGAVTYGLGIAPVVSAVFDPDRNPALRKSTIA